jgi:hypothetical protein
MRGMTAIMTILVAVRTGSAAVLAADSKLTTQGPAGKNPDGTVRWLPQTYDHAVKITQDGSSTAVAAFAGHANIGHQSAVDYFARQDLWLEVAPAEQDEKLRAMANRMMEERHRAAATYGYPPENMAPTTILLAAPPTEGVAPRVWRIGLQGKDAEVREILQTPLVWFEGSPAATMALLYGLDGQRAEALRERLGIEPETFQQAEADTIDVAAVKSINFWTMPVQDAIDFAVFAAQVQVEMDRFLPGFGNCGGPIDVMTLEMAPTPTIRSFPGKTLRHPHLGQRP